MPGGTEVTLFGAGSASEPVEIVVKRELNLFIAGFKDRTDYSYHEVFDGLFQLLHKRFDMICLQASGFCQQLKLIYLTLRLFDLSLDADLRIRLNIINWCDGSYLLNVRMALFQIIKPTTMSIEQRVGDCAAGLIKTPRDPTFESFFPKSFNLVMLQGVFCIGIFDDKRVTKAVAMCLQKIMEFDPEGKFRISPAVLEILQGLKFLVEHMDGRVSSLFQTVGNPGIAAAPGFGLHKPWYLRNITEFHVLREHCAVAITSVISAFFVGIVKRDLETHFYRLFNLHGKDLYDQLYPVLASMGTLRQWIREDVMACQLRNPMFEFPVLKEVPMSKFMFDYNMVPEGVEMMESKMDIATKILAKASHEKFFQCHQVMYDNQRVHQGSLDLVERAVTEYVRGETPRLT